VLIATTASRLTLPWSCRTSIPAARPDGLGTVVAGTVRPITAALATAVVLIAALLLTWPAALGPAATTADAPPPADTTTATLHLVGTTAAVLLTVGTSLLTTRRARTALGGTTGDVLGATVELALPITLLTLALTA
jgi:adenosylcobinamide-GDP ribazoletransferase